jgi:hypothetical protein
MTHRTYLIALHSLTAFLTIWLNAPIYLVLSRKEAVQN